MGGSSGPAPAPYGYNAQGQAVGKAERDAWNSRLAKSGRSSQEEYQYQLAKQAQDRQMAMFSMFEMGGSGLHTPSFGPSEEEVEADRVTKGINDLNSAYDVYLGASQDAASLVNKQISSERSNANLLGLDFSVTDESKTQRISDAFANTFTSKQFADLTKLNEDFGQSRLDQGEGLDAFEFLVQRGAATGDTAEDKKTTGSFDKSGASATTSLSLLDDDPTRAFSALGA